MAVPESLVDHSRHPLSTSGAHIGALACRNRVVNETSTDFPDVSTKTNTTQWPSMSGSDVPTVGVVEILSMPRVEEGGGQWVDA